MLVTFRKLSEGKELDDVMPCGRPRGACAPPRQVLPGDLRGARDRRLRSLAYAYEILVRAHATAGELEHAAHYKAQAREAAERIADDDDREHLISDLGTLPR